METFSVLLALCAGNSPVTGEFPAERSVTRSFDVFFDLRRYTRNIKMLNMNYLTDSTGVSKVIHIQHVDIPWSFQSSVYLITIAPDDDAQQVAILFPK